MLVQAAGHGLLRLSKTNPRAVIKPTTAVEADMYQRLNSDPTLAPLRKFVPRLVHIASLDHVDALHPLHTHEIEIENLCLLGETDAWSDDTTGPGSDEEHPREFRPTKPLMSVPSQLGLDEGGAEAVPVAFFENANNQLATPNGPVRTPESVTTPTRTAWSDPCVLDIKLGKIRHGPSTKPEKIARILEKDKGTTGPILGLRICGLRHEHRRIDVNSTLTSRDHGVDRVVGRVDSFGPHVHDDDDEHHSALCDYDTMRSQRSERSFADSVLSRTHTPLIADPPMALPADERDSVKRRRRLRAALGQRLEWVEGKDLGRTVDSQGFIEALAKYCTCLEFRRHEPQQGDGEHPVPEADSLSGSRTNSPGAGRSANAFAARPHIPLVMAYRDAAIELRDAFASSDVLEHYSFASASIICVHDFHVDISPVSAEASTPDDDGRHPWSQSVQIKFRAQLRLVDFSSSGALKDRNVFSDHEVGCFEGLRNLVSAFEAVIERYSPHVEC